MPVIDDRWRSLMAAIVQQAIDDINAAHKFTLKRLLEDDEITASNRYRSGNKNVERAYRRMERWQLLQAEHAVNFFFSPLWYDIAEVLGLDPEYIPRGLRYKIDQVANRIGKLNQARQERIRKRKAEAVRI